MHLSEGTLLQGGKYSIIRRLGQGGFGITYLASQTSLDRKVVVKEFFIGEYCERDTDTSRVSLGTSGSRDMVLSFLKKFIKEARNIASLDHPNIVRVIDVFEENGTAYYVMEYHSGGSLGAFVGGKEKMSEEDAVRYIRQIASALKYIHSRSIMHLDVKPDNILLNSRSEAVLIDFGLAKHYDEQGKASTTTPGGISHGYAPLEQYDLSGGALFTPTMDIYSLGATLYALLCGETPPKASAILMDGLPPLPETVSLSTCAAVYKAMLPKAKDRPQSIDEFLALLDEEVVLDDNNVTNSTVAINSNNASSSTAAANSSTVAANKTIEKTKVFTGNNSSASNNDNNSNQPRKPFNWKLPAGIVATLLCIVFAGFGVKECNDYRAEQAEEARLAALAAIEQARLAVEKQRNDSIAAEKARLAAVKRHNDSIAAEKARLAAIEQARLAAEKRRNDSVAAEKARLAAIEQARRDSIAAVKRHNDLINKQFSGLRIACVKNSDGSLHYFTAGEWEANSAKSSYNKLGVLLSANGREFIIAAKDCVKSNGGNSFYFGACGVDIYGVKNHTDKNNLDNIWTGKEDTRAIIKQAKGKNDKDGILGAPAAEAAWNYKACSNDLLQWYLPSISELRLMYKNITKINNFLDKYFGGGSIADYYYWSSTSYDSYWSWYVNMYYGHSNGGGRTYSYRVRAVAVAK